MNNTFFYWHEPCDLFWVKFVVMFSFRQSLVASQSVMAVPAEPQLSSSHSSAQHPSFPSSSPQHYSSPSNNHPTFCASSLDPSCSNRVFPHLDLSLPLTPILPSSPHYSPSSPLPGNLSHNLSSLLLGPSHSFPHCSSPSPQWKR